MKLQTFELTVPDNNRPVLLAELEKLEHVTVDPVTHKGHAVPPDGAGLEFDFEPSEHKDKVKITVTKNPHGVSLDYIMGRLDGDVKYLSVPPTGSTVGMLD